MDAQDNVLEAYCLYACDYPDGACQDVGTCIELTGGGGACLPPADNGYLDPCAFPLETCLDGLLCLITKVDMDDNPLESYCLYKCDDPPNGTCTDKGECIELAGDPPPNYGACIPPGDAQHGQFCDFPLSMCVSNLTCLTFSDTAENGYCASECTGPPLNTGCPIGGDPPAECFLSNGTTYFCGYSCGTASECPDGGVGWSCNVEGGRFCVPN